MKNIAEVTYKDWAFLFLILASFIYAGSALAQTTTCTPGDINCGLVGHWALNEGSGSTANDTSCSDFGNPANCIANNGTLVNNPAWIIGGNGGLSFNATSSQAVTTPSLTIPGNFTWSLWINVPSTDTAQNDPIMSQGSVALSLYYGNQLFFTVSGNDSDAAVSDNPLNDGAWHHIVLIEDNNTQTMYVDDVLQTATASQTLSGSSGSLYLGEAQYHGFFIGSINDVRVYNRALDGDEVSALYKNQIPPGVFNGQPNANLPQGTTSTTLSVSTDANAVCRYGTVANTTYANLPNTFSITGGTSHSSTINGLMNGGVGYTYYVRCANAATGTQDTTDYVITFGVAGTKTVSQNLINGQPPNYTTIRACANAAQQGDTCLIYGGTYHETLSPANSGTYTLPITFEAATGAVVKVDGINLHSLCPPSPTSPVCTQDNFYAANNINIIGLNFNSITQYGITWTFDNYYLTGLFANEDFWVLGPVTINTMTPAFNGEHNGWEVNPAPEYTESYDGGGLTSFTPSAVPALPYVAAPNASTPIISIVKSFSYYQDPSYYPYCHNDPNECLETAAVLTVVNSVPPNNGTTVFRPPYVGANKYLYNSNSPYYPVSALQTNLLPSLAPVANTPTFATEFEEQRHMQMEHLKGELAVTVEPYFNMPTYGPYIGRNNTEAMLRLMLNDPITDKMPLLIAVIQGGIDRYQAAVNGQTWDTGDAVWAGEKISIAFAGVLLNDPGMQDYVNWASHENIIDVEDIALLLKTNSGLPIYAGYPWGQTGWISEDYPLYWQAQSSGSFSNAGGGGSDPYGFSEGSGVVSVADGYQIAFTSGGPWKASGLVASLIPQIKQDWNNPNFFNYVDRWQTTGEVAEPDPCAPLVGVCKVGNIGARCTTQTETISLNAPNDPGPGYTVTGNSACGSAQIFNGDVCDYASVFNTEYGYSYGDVVNADGSHSCILDQNLTSGSTMQSFSCQSGKVCGRYPDRQGAFKGNDGLVGSAFVDSMWTAYRSATFTVPSPTVNLTTNVSSVVGYLSTVYLSATASAAAGANITKVEFYNGVTLLGTITSSPYNYTWTNVSAGSYRLFAIAYDNMGNSSASAVVNTAVNNGSNPVIPDTPSVPTGLIAHNITQTSITLSWNAPANEEAYTGYNVYRNGTLIASPTTLSYTDSSLTQATTYSYTVSAFNEAGNTSAQTPAVSVTTLGNASSPDTTSNLAGYWKLNEDSGTIAADSSGSGNVGTLVGGPTWVPGALQFNGNSSVSAGINNLPTGGAAMSISAWVYTGSSSSSGQIISRMDNINVLTTGVGWLLRFEGSANHLVFYDVSSGNSGLYKIDSGISITPNTWQHVVVTFDGVFTMNFYVNGSLTSSVLVNAGVGFPSGPVGSTITIASASSATIDEVRVYARALQAGDVSALFSLGQTATTAPVTYSLTVSTAGNGFGEVTSTNGNINCGVNTTPPNVCSETVNAGIAVTLTAAPATGSTFSGWSGGGCSGTGSCVVTMNTAQSVTATFTASPSVNGACGSAATTYLYTQTSFGINVLCKTGTPNPATVTFPAPGNKATWTCDGSNNGLNSSCTAKRNSMTIREL